MIIKKGKCYYKLGQVWCMHYKEGQVLLQSGTGFDACIINKGKCYYKVGQVWCMHYKKGECYYKLGQA